MRAFINMIILGTRKPSLQCMTRTRSSVSLATSMKTNEGETKKVGSYPSVGPCKQACKFETRHASPLKQAVRPVTTTLWRTLLSVLRVLSSF